MSTPRFEAFLAKIYVDAEARARFLADTRGEAIRAGLTEPEISALEKIDRIGLELTAQSLQRKRRHLKDTLKRRETSKYAKYLINLLRR